MDDPLKKAADACQGFAKLAELLGATPQTVSNWRSRGVPTERCHDVERASSGAVKCEDLRPDVRWHRVKDAQWPWHPKGRPLVDVAAKQEAA